MEEFDLNKFRVIVFKYKFTILAIVVASVIIGLIYSFGFVKPKYKSSTTFVLGKVENTITIDLDTKQITQTEIVITPAMIDTYDYLIKSTSFAQAVIDKLGVKITVDEFVKSVSIHNIYNTNVLEISVVSNRADLSCSIANATRQVFEERAKKIHAINQIEVIDIAATELQPFNVHHKQDVVIAAFIGIIISAIYVYIYYLFFEKPFIANEQRVKELNKQDIKQSIEDKNSEMARDSINVIEEKYVLENNEVYDDEVNEKGIILYPGKWFKQAWNQIVEACKATFRGIKKLCNLIVVTIKKLIKIAKTNKEEYSKKHAEKSEIRQKEKQEQKVKSDKVKAEKQALKQKIKEAKEVEQQKKLEAKKQEEIKKQEEKKIELEKQEAEKKAQEQFDKLQKEKEQKEEARAKELVKQAQEEIKKQEVNEHEDNNIDSNKHNEEDYDKNDKAEENDEDESFSDLYRIDYKEQISNKNSNKNNNKKKNKKSKKQHK